MLAKLFSFWNSPSGRISALLFLVLSLLTPAYPQTPSDDLMQMNIEEPMNVEVTSVSRYEQSLPKTDAAIFVITEEDIQRSGATNIPDLLRMVPGVQVAQINASSWAVSIGGFNGRFCNQSAGDGRRSNGVRAFLRRLPQLPTPLPFSAPLPAQREHGLGTAAPPDR